MQAAMSNKRLYLLIFTLFGLGFISWMLGNPGVKDFRYWLNPAGMLLISLGVIGFIALMVSYSHAWSQPKRIGAFVLVAALLTFFSSAILSLEYGVLNFGDSDLPPYQPDTAFERAFDFVWFTITVGAALMWIFIFMCAIASLFRIIKRRVAS